MVWGFSNNAWPHSFEYTFKPWRSPGIWSGVEFVYERHKGSDVMLMHLKDEDVETLEEKTELSLMSFLGMSFSVDFSRD